VVGSKNRDHDRNYSCSLVEIAFRALHRTTAPTPITRETTATSLPHILPGDLANTVKRLEDRDLDRLLSAVLAEQKRRGENVPASGRSPRNRHVEFVPVALTSGKLNAVRAAFKAGITPSRIARQFGISQSGVRKALASDSTKPRG